VAEHLAAFGPAIINASSAGKTNSLAYYYFQGQCYGSGCPTN
jgi:hypothetical protein